MTIDKNILAVAYARYSTDRQDGRSIEDQLRRCSVVAETGGARISAVYSDAAVSGSHTDRADLQRLIADAKARAFRTVFVDDLSRLSRDLGDTWRIVFQEMASIGVRVVDCSTNIASDAEGARLLFGVKALVNDEFLQNVRRQTWRGLEGRALTGFHTGGKTYGYTTVTEENPPDSEHPRKVPVIHPDEAATVLRTFKLFTEGQSCQKIACTLNEEGIDAPHDGGRGHKHSRGWGHTTIRAMLQNPRYIGRLTWNQRKFVRIPGKRCRRAIARPESEHVTKELPSLRIVPIDLWESAQRRFAGSSAKARAGRPPGSCREPSVLSGLLKCGVCSGSMVVVGRVKKGGASYTNLGCSAHRSRGAAICANNRTVSEKKVRESVLGFLKQSFSDSEMIQRFIQRFQEHFARIEKGAPTAELAEHIRQAEQRVSNLLDALAKMGWSESLAGRVKEDEERLTALRTRAAELSRSRPKTVPHPRIIEGYLRNLLAILDGDRGRARDLLAKHLGQLVLTPGPGGYTITGAFGLALSVEGEVEGGVCDNWSSGGVI